jgi:hypothetical protein
MKPTNRFELAVIAEEWTLSKLSDEADFAEFPASPFHQGLGVHSAQGDHRVSDG